MKIISAHYYSLHTGLTVRKIHSKPRSQLIKRQPWHQTHRVLEEMERRMKTIGRVISIGSVLNYSAFLLFYFSLYDFSALSHLNIYNNGAFSYLFFMCLPHWKEYCSSYLFLCSKLPLTWDLKNNIYLLPYSFCRVGVLVPLYQVLFFGSHKYAVNLASRHSHLKLWVRICSQVHSYCQPKPGNWIITWKILVQLKCPIHARDQLHSVISSSSPLLLNYKLVNKKLLTWPSLNAASQCCFFLKY